MGILDNFDLSQVYGGGGPGDPLIGLSMGLLSQRGVGRGLAAGMQNVAAMGALNQQRQRQATLDKMAADREARQAANDALIEQWRQKNFDANKQQHADEFGLQKAQFDALNATRAAELDIQKQNAARLASESNKPFVMGQDSLGRQIYGTMQNGTPTPMQLPQAAPTSVPVPEAHGEDYIKTLEPGVQEQVRAIVQGRAPYPSQAMMRTPLGESLARHIAIADPTFEASNPTARAKMTVDASTGKLAQNNNALNTALGHLMELSDAAKGLDNYSFTPANVAKNWLSTTFGSKSVTDFNTIRDKVAEEFTRVYRGAGGSEADIKREIENLNAANSPDQLHSAIGKMAELAQSKIAANQEQYNSVMGPMAKPREMVSDKSKAALEELGRRAKGETAPKSTGKGWSLD